jgi:hypothetical protein
VVTQVARLANAAGSRRAIKAKVADAKTWLSATAAVDSGT